MTQFIDPNRFYRTGGLDKKKLTESMKRGDIHALFIQAGIGLTPSVILQEQCEVADEVGLPYLTWHIPDCRVPIIDQVQTYLSWAGVSGHVTCCDLESPDGVTRYLNAAELEQYFKYLMTKDDPWLYTRVNILEALYKVLPDWLNPKFWIAQYPYEKWVNGKGVKYQKFDTFNAKWSNQLPPAVVASKLFASQFRRNQVAAWQFTDNGLAQLYLASATTNHPVYRNGITEADLNVVPFMTPDQLTYLLGGVKPIEKTLEQRVDSLEYRVLALETK